MSITKEKKSKLIKEFKINDKDTGSAEVQVAILSEKIKSLTEHLKQHHKDFISRRGLLSMVGKRRNLLSYIKKKSETKYSELINTLGLRR
jgi:small subunit ribosomal protein S15